MSQPIILIQSRKGGTRLPNKVNQLIGSKRMIDHVMDRCRLSGIKWSACRAEDYAWTVPENDVLGRFQAHLTLIDPEGDHYDPIIRITGDCPMVEPWVIQATLALYREKEGATLVGTGPEWDGMDVQVFSRRGLARAHERALEPYDREHVCSWMKGHGRYVEIPLEGPALRWSVDDQEGLDFVRRVFALCSLCAGAVNHHTNSRGSIGGGDRHPVWDLHHLDRGDLAECTAYDLLMTRTGGAPYVSV